MNVPAMIKIRFWLPAEYHPHRDQDYERPFVPRLGDNVELSLADGSPQSFTVEAVDWMFHDVIPADVVIELS